MRIPYRWIREFVALDLGPAEAADRLTNAGIEVSAVEPQTPDFKGVVVGEIEAVEGEIGQSRHGYPLFRCRVSTGRARYAVVCGAPNTAAGVRAAFAPPGAVLPGGRAVGVATVHGVQSQGMLCSERELGLGEEHEAGLLVLDGARPGDDLVRHLGLDDHVLEVEVTPNRPDCLSVVGVARELAALTGARFTPPRVVLREAGPAARSLVRVRIEARDLCRRFTARVIDGLRVGPSPVWLRVRLRMVGLRPISNVVDVTNYVMWELGQPLHAFDWARVTDHTIVVRRARPGERLRTLDGQDRALEPSMLLIADPARALGIAGVMGGAESEVSAATTRVLLEAAWFAPASIRRTSRALGLKTDAAYRFERGADLEGLAEASARAAQLMAELGGGTVRRGMVDAYPVRRRPARLTLRLARVRRVLGVAPPPARARRILAGLGLPTSIRGQRLVVDVPSFRRDLALEDDLVEEVIRVWGYDRIPSVLSPHPSAAVRLPPSLRQAQTARRALTGAGLTEVVTYAFSDPARAARLQAPGEPAPLALANPLSQDASLLRQHPLEGVLGVVATNLRLQQPSVRVFEISHTYARADGGTREARWVALALAGARADLAWHAPAAPADVYDAKGLAEHVLAAFGVTARLAPGRLGGFEPDAHGALATADGTVVAEFGEVALAAREAFGIDAPVFAAAVALDVLAALPAPVPRHQPLPRFPAVERDLAFVASAERPVTAAQLETALREAAGPLLRDVRLFDVFRFPDGRGSLAWRLVFQAADRTLTDDEVNGVVERVARHVTDTLGVALRRT